MNHYFISFLNGNVYVSIETQETMGWRGLLTWSLAFASWRRSYSVTVTLRISRNQSDKPDIAAVAEFQGRNFVISKHWSDCLLYA